MRQDFIDRRKYIRLNSCFPVEFSLYLSAEKPLPNSYQGFTRNLSEGGLCLEARNLSNEDSQLVLSRRPEFNLVIDIPILRRPVKATAKIAWVKKDESDKGRNSFFIGLSYLKIEPLERKRIVNYARRLKYLPRITAALLVLMLLGISALSFYHMCMKRQNRQLVSRLVAISEVKASLEKRLNEFNIRKDMLESKLADSTRNAARLKEKIAQIENRLAGERQRLEAELDKTRAQQKELESKISGLPTDEISSGGMAYKVTESRLTNLNERIELLQVELSEVAKKADAEKKHLMAKLSSLQQDNIELRGQIELTQKGGTLLEEQLADIRLKSGKLTQASVGKMLKWLKSHQIKKTGLVLSYEGDKALKDWGFIYDQSLACQAFLITGETERAGKILRFFSDEVERSNGLFYNAYDVKTGLPCEYVIHSGPNIWVAIAACQYTRRTRDNAFLRLAKDIASEIMKLQALSGDGDIKGGPDTEWVSTEHNLDAYALFNMLYELTEEEVYKKAASAVFGWLKDAGYNKQEGRFLRGKGDATVATDTFSWAIASIGPEKLAANGMDPDRIMEFAEAECRVETRFDRPEGRGVDVTGFDFAKAEHLARGGIVSTEWTAQMVVAFKMMAKYYKDKGDIEKERIYDFKAGYYLSQLGKMVVSSPSPTGQGEGCLPYASMDNVRTGHGWRVAKGKRTGSVAATAYYIFAYEDYNPLRF